MTRSWKLGERCDFQSPCLYMFLLLINYLLNFLIFIDVGSASQAAPVRCRLNGRCSVSQFHWLYFYSLYAISKNIQFYCLTNYIYFFPFASPSAISTSASSKAAVSAPQIPDPVNSNRSSSRPAESAVDQLLARIERV